MSDLVERLRRTTEHMASQCSAPMGLWNNHSNAVLEAADVIERLLAERQWRPIETAPKDGTAVLAFCQPTYIETGKPMPFNYLNVVRWRQRPRYRDDTEADTWGWAHTLSGSNAQPIHWQPLPAPPKGGNHE